MELIKTENLFATYKIDKEEFIVLKDINLEVNEGDFILIFGQSGSGKTTLINVLSGLKKHSSGNLYIFGNDVLNYHEKDFASLRKKDFGFVFQSYQLIPTLTAYENVKLAMSIAKSKDYKKIDETLDKLGILNIKDKYPSQLSGGQQQRICIARALINNPKIIFADEPTGALDSKNGYEVLEILSKLNKEENVTIVIVSHCEDYIKYASKVIRLKDGEII